MKTLTLEEKIAELEEELAERDDTISELQNKVSRLRNELREAEEELFEYENAPEKFDSEIVGIEKIEFATNGNLVDEEVMEALAEALEKLTPYQVIERLRA